MYERYETMMDYIGTKHNDLSKSIDAIDQRIATLEARIKVLREIIAVGESIVENDVEYEDCLNGYRQEIKRAQLDADTLRLDYLDQIRARKFLDLVVERKDEPPW